MEWRIKLEARSGWGWVETIELASFKRRVVGLTAEEIGLSLEEAKQILAELQRRVLQTQMEEYTYCALSVQPVSRCVASALPARGPFRRCLGR